jgi:dGTPase
VLVDRAPEALDRPFADDWRAAADDAARLRVVVDQVASLTDASAVAWHTRLCG